MGTQGRLIRQFPFTAVAIPVEIFRDHEFLSVIAQAVSKMSWQTVPEMKPVIYKGSQKHIEDRNTVKPLVVTEYLTSFLLGLGHSAVVPRVCKNTREEVLWNNSFRPWRRSPTWLLIRVALQLAFEGGQSGTIAGGLMYKKFMVFFMFCILGEACTQRMDSDILHTMSAKICRRLMKLRPLSDGDWIQKISDNIAKASTLIQDRWCLIRQEADPKLHLNGLKELEFDHDKFFHLPEVDEFISIVSSLDPVLCLHSFAPTSELPEMRVDKLPREMLTGFPDQYKPFRLAEFENWVATCLDQWMSMGVRKLEICNDLSALAQSYHRQAEAFYSNNPEGYSRMLLTVLEMWVVVDKAATDDVSLMNQYGPEISTSIFQALIQFSQTDMMRLHRVETYLRVRNENAQMGYIPSIFTCFGEEDSFSVRFASQSALHLNLLQRIELQAESDKREKLAQLGKLKERYQWLMTLYDSSDCEYVDSTNARGERIRTHSNICQRCQYQREAEDLTIDVHEWPLPHDRPKALSIVFELDPPQAFRAWRDLTMYVQYEVLKCQPRQKRSPKHSYPLSTYSGLLRWHVKAGAQRVDLLSEVKPHIHTHRRGKAISDLGDRDVCVNNGLRLKYYDRHRNIFLSEPCPTTELSLRCTIRLPPQSTCLSDFLVRNHERPDGMTPNEVAASLQKCPGHLSIGESKALMVLPFGHKLQWMSVLRELSSPQVDFSKVETATFVAQITLQAGPQNNQASRASHGILEEVGFAQRFLDALCKSVERIEKNPESYWALWSFTLLATRVLSMVPDTEARDYLHFLERCRKLSKKWVNRIHIKLSETHNGEQKSLLRSMALDIALVCFDTFSVDPKYLKRILRKPKQASILIELSIIIRSSLPAEDAQKDGLKSFLVDRWRHLMHRSSPVVRDQVLRHQNDCLDRAIGRYWSSYRPQLAWCSVPSAIYWLETTFESLQVDYNTLTGEFLVNGLPLSRLPSEYLNHETYKRLLGNRVLEVSPSSVRGMSFSGMKQISGNSLHFRLVPFSAETMELLVHASSTDSSLDLLPPWTLSSRLPKSLVDEYAHWYNRNEEVIELRPIAYPWTSSPESWKLIRCGHHWELTREDGVCLVNPSSRTGHHVSSILLPLESTQHIHLVYSPAKSCLNIELPRKKLKFHLDQGSSVIYSRQFHMQIDEEQSIGTLTGLRSKLVLIDPKDRDRRVLLVPEGEVSYEMTRSRDGTATHVQVIVKHDTAARVHSYSIDNLLGRLIDSGTLQSKLFLSYLHALTSYCLPDPLISKTGTEQALHILDSAAVRSFDSLTAENHALLMKISRLTPGNEFYPVHEKGMQKTTWCEHLSYVSQHGEFYNRASGIVDKARRVKFLYPSESMPVAKFDHANPELLNRGLIRSAYMRVTGYGAEHFTTSRDVHYRSREEGEQLRAERASRTSRQIYTGERSIQATPPQEFASTIYNLLSQVSSLPVHHKIPEPHELDYDSKWLTEPKKHIPPLWCALHYASQADASQLNGFALVAWFAALSYADGVGDIINVLLSMVTCPNISAVNLPHPLNYNLPSGIRFRSSIIRDTVKLNAKDLGQCPEVHLQKLPTESKKQAKDRRRQQYNVNLGAALDSYVHQLQGQFPCEHPQGPSSSSITTYINSDKAMSAVKVYWDDWYSNSLFMSYLKRLVTAVRTADVKLLHAPPRHLLPAVKPTGHSPGYITVCNLYEGAVCFDIRVPHPCMNLQLKSGREHNFRGQLTPVLRRLEEKAEFHYQHQYLGELRDSASSLRRGYPSQPVISQPPAQLEALFSDHKGKCESRVRRLYESLMKHTDPPALLLKSQPSHCTRVDTKIFSMLMKVGFYPRRSCTFFLEQLERSQWGKLSEEWREKIVEYGVAITSLQRAERLLKGCRNQYELAKEIQNEGHENWSPIDYPDWLLMECESGILIRRVQQEIAQKMMAPPDDQNSVMQLNMGEGKSSVIIPMVASALGGRQLVRVIVAKPQFKQMQQTLIAKISGMISRRVYQLPISRALSLNHSELSIIYDMVQECQQEGGIMLVQPEHLLSFQLMGLESTLRGDEKLASILLRTQGYFDRHTRDLIDESDENFSVKFELVYTIGHQRAVEHSPTRWTVVQEVLGLVRDLARDILTEMPQSMEFHTWSGSDGSGRFPRIRIFRSDAMQRLVCDLTNRIGTHGLQGFPIARQSPEIRAAVFRYISEPSLTPEEILAVERSVIWRDGVRETLLLLRGLIAGGILAFALMQKRWRVNYGVASNRVPRSRLAVPFRAKDDPAPRSEFSQPDVVVLLTCFSYYYSGLTDDDLFEALDHLKRDDQKIPEYEAWVSSAPALPIAFQELRGINLRDHGQCVSEVFPYLRFSKGAIDYFLSRAVFSREVKEYPHKLSASGWDLGKLKVHPTTGFSGTNDTRYILPRGVRQLDLPEQRHANALVLEYLLQDENDVALVPTTPGSAEAIDGSGFLRMVTQLEPRARVILDVGAQIIDLTNREVASTWLNLAVSDDSQTEAVIFFDCEDTLAVLDRSGHVEPFQTSPFSKQTENCLVFLDEAHTRGTDLNLPPDYRAAVTLGANLTKDRLVQGK